MMEILKRIDGLFITPVSQGADEQNKILCGELPFKVLEYKSGREYNGWTVPHQWEVIRAEIRKDGKLIYDGRRHPLGVIGYSQSFGGRIGLKELREHLFYKKDAPNNIVYYCDLYYKPFRKLWGFSVPYNLYISLDDGEYEVNLETSHIPGTMKVLEYIHKGELEDTIILNAHNCHAAQLNDGPSGYIVGIEVMKRLEGMKTRYTYKLVIAPEHIGTVFYLADLDSKTLKDYKFCIFLEMLGHDYPHFALQESFTGGTDLDHAAANYFKFKDPEFYQDKFRKIVGNDETVWEAAGIEIPTISLSRCQRGGVYYPEYHLDSDNLSIIKEKRLEEAAEAALGIIDILETNRKMARKFTGLIALGNPKFDLYLNTADPSVDRIVTGEQKQWNYLMDCLPRYFDGKTSVLDVAIKHDLPYHEVYNYVARFKEKGLIELV